MKKDSTLYFRTAKIHLVFLWVPQITATMENHDEPATGADEGSAYFIPKKDEALLRVSFNTL